MVAQGSQGLFFKRGRYGCERFTRIFYAKFFLGKDVMGLQGFFEMRGVFKRKDAMVAEGSQGFF